MYILVRSSDNVIVGCAINSVDERAASQNGHIVYEIPDNEFSPKIIGSQITGFEIDE